MTKETEKLAHSVFKSAESFANQDMSSSDVVEVVRCKDCKYNRYNERRFFDDDVIAWYAWCECFQEEHGFDGYCSFAKRKDFDGDGER